VTVILLRHGRSTSNTAHVLAGRSEGVELDDKGREQAAGLVERIGELPIRAVVSSPLLRCRQTVEPLKEPLWAVVQAHPSAAVFPGGEGLAEVQTRAVAAVREHDARLAEQHNGDVLWLACTHGDVIKAVVADALGLHLDGFQRVSADPASVSVIRYTRLRPFVLHSNHTGASLTSALTPPPAPEGDPPTEDAVVGGSTD
jgi:broad specificity phosphatase PhoE